MNNPSTTNLPTREDAAPEAVEDALDEGLEESFPASDPVAIAIEHPDKAREGP